MAAKKKVVGFVVITIAVAIAMVARIIGLVAV